MRRIGPFVVLLILSASCGEATRIGEGAPTPTPAAVATASPPAPSFSPSPSPVPIAELIARIDPARLEAHMKALAAAGSRDARHPGHAKAVAYIKDQLAAIPGITVTDHLASYQGIPLDNILARVEPGAAASARTYGIIAAHYDSIANRTPGWRPALDPAPGADDNATGTAALMEYARILAAERDSLRLPVVLAFFDGEELFFKGSLAYFQSLPAPAPVAWVLNIDMVGFNPIADRLDLIYYTTGSAGLRDRVKEANDRYAIGVSPLFLQLATNEATILDAAPFGLAGIPAVALVERYGENDSMYPGNTFFHTVGDTPDRVSNTRLWLKAAKLVLASALELARP